MTADGDQIEPSVVIDVDKCRSPLDPGQRPQRNARSIGDLFEVPVTFIAIEQIVLVGKIRDRDGWAAGVIVITERNSHGRLLRAVIAYGRPRLEPDVGEFAIAFVFVKVFWRGIVRDVYVGTPRVVEVGPDDAEAVVTRTIVDSSRLGDVRESTVTVIMKKRVAGSAQAARATLYVDTAIFAERRAAEARQVVEMEVHIVGDHQIDIAIAIVVAKGSTGGPAPIGDAGFLRYIGECVIS